MIGLLILMGFIGAAFIGGMQDDENELEGLPQKKENDEETGPRLELSPPAGSDTPSAEDTLDPFREDASGPVTNYRSGDEGGFNIDVDFKGDWTAYEQIAIKAAADYLSEIIVDDVADVTSRGERLDDLQISVSKEDIDDRYGVLASASVKEVRAGSYLPTRGEIRFDSADIERLQRVGDWDSTVLHEMFHTVGFGVTWASQGLLSNEGAAGLRFTGENAIAAYKSDYDDISKDPYHTRGVPVEEHGGSGTAGSHWDEDSFDGEFMTGILDRNDHISKISIAALEDMGYDTLWDDVTKSGDASGQFGYA